MCPMLTCYVYNITKQNATLEVRLVINLIANQFFCGMRLIHF